MNKLVEYLFLNVSEFCEKTEIMHHVIPIRDETAESQNRMQIVADCQCLSLF